MIWKKRAEIGRRIWRATALGLASPLFLLGWLAGTVFKIADLAKAYVEEGFLKGSKIE